ncbi:MAG: purine-nucleoside phosphorylase [Solirubrobacterales bacterium]
MPIHVHPTAELAPDVLLPGDPGRALMLAQHLLEAPRMFNHNRGLWGYTGRTPEGEQLTIQATGMGSPSAAIVFAELADLGIERAIRVGTCGALDPEFGLGEVIVATEALAVDGTSAALGGERVRTGDAGLGAALARGARSSGTRIVSTDLFYDPDPERERGWRSEGARAVEMEAAALFTLGRERGVRTGCVLVVSDLVAERQRIDAEELERRAKAMGDAALAALRDDQSGVTSSEA